MLVKIHNANGRVVVSIADENIIGKEFEDGEKYLKISEHFYKGERKSDEETIKCLKNASSLNIVGKKSIDFALKNKLIETGHVLTIGKISYAIVVFYAK